MWCSLKIPISSQRKHSGHLVFVGPVPFTFWQMASLLCPVVLVNISSMDSTPSHFRVGVLPSVGHSAYPFSPSPLPFPANDWFSCLSEAQWGPIEMKGTGDCCLSTAWTKPITNKQGTEFKNKLFWYNHFEKLFLQYLLKLKINIPMIKPSYSQEKYTSMLTKETLQIATLFVIALIWKQPKCPSRRE